MTDRDLLLPADAVRNLRQHVGEELEKRRQQARLSREHVVQHLRVQPRTLASWEHGARAITVDNFVAVCFAIHASPPAVLRDGLHRAGCQPCASCGEIRWMYSDG